MCKVALIDDMKDQYEKYRIILAQKNIELVFMEYIQDYPTIIQWLLDEQIEFVLIDYKLNTKYQFQGSELIYEINNSIPDLQCVLITSNTLDDDLIMDKLKIDKSVFYDDEHFDEFIEIIKQGVRVFHNRQQKTLDEYKRLKRKQKLTAIEEEHLKWLYNRLVSYGMVERMSEEMMNTRVEKKLDTLIDVVEKYLNNKE